jgi:hypothetical protein
MFALAADGKTKRKGMPNPLRLAVIARAHFDDVRLPFPPAWMQKLGLALGAPLGRLLGYGATYEAAAPSERASRPDALGGFGGIGLVDGVPLVAVRQGRRERPYP